MNSCRATQPEETVVSDCGESAGGAAFSQVGELGPKIPEHVHSCPLTAHKKWKYKDDICIGCQQETETGDELLFCDGYGKGGSEEDITNMSYNMFFSGMSSDMHLLAKVISRRLKIREKMLEGIT